MLDCASIPCRLSFLSTVTGIGNPDDYFSCLLRGCVDMGAFPDYGEVRLLDAGCIHLA